MGGKGEEVPASMGRESHVCQQPRHFGRRRQLAQQRTASERRQRRSAQRDGVRFARTVLPSARSSAANGSVRGPCGYWAACSIACGIGIESGGGVWVAWRGLRDVFEAVAAATHKSSTTAAPVAVLCAAHAIRTAVLAVGTSAVASVASTANAILAAACPSVDPAANTRKPEIGEMSSAGAPIGPGIQVVPRRFFRFRYCQAMRVEHSTVSIVWR